jgi:hypothetical protein
MDDILELTDPDHPDAQEAAASAARLLVHLHHARQARPGENVAQSQSDTKGDAPCPDTSPVNTTMDK